MLRSKEIYSWARSGSGSFRCHVPRSTRFGFRSDSKGLESATSKYPHRKKPKSKVGKYLEKAINIKCPSQLALKENSGFRQLKSRPKKPFLTHRKVSHKAVHSEKQTSSFVWNAAFLIRRKRSHSRVFLQLACRRRLHLRGWFIQTFSFRFFECY